MLTISFNGHFHMRRKETFYELNFSDIIRFEMRSFLSELMLINNAFADIVIYKAVRFE